MQIGEKIFGPQKKLGTKIGIVAGKGLIMNNRVYKRGYLTHLEAEKDFLPFCPAFVQNWTIISKYSMRCTGSFIRDMKKQVRFRELHTKNT